MDASGKYKAVGGGTMFDLPRQLQVEQCYIADRYLLSSGRGRVGGSMTGVRLFET